MAIVTKDSNLEKGSEVQFTLNITDLLAHASISGDSYFSDQSNWRIVVVRYKSIPGLQSEILVFKNVDSGNTDVANFKVSQKARDSFFVEYIIIVDKQDGKLRLKRSDLVTADFDIHFGEQPVVFTGFDPAVSATDNEINLIDDMQSDILEIRNNTGKVGDIKHSLLNEAAFQAVHGSGWVLMDGRNIAGSDFETITGMSAIPDARGQFLRGFDNGRGIDPNRILGGGQSDATARPNQGFSATTSYAGTHSHQLWSANSGGANSNPISYTGTGITGEASGSDGWRGSSTDDNVVRRSGNHRHTLTITGGGDSETRPVNVAVNIFVKINA